METFVALLMLSAVLCLEVFAVTCQRVGRYELGGS